MYLATSLPCMCGHVVLVKCKFMCYSNLSASIILLFGTCHSTHLCNASFFVSAKFKQQQEAAIGSANALHDAADDASANVGHDATSNSASA